MINKRHEIKTVFLFYMKHVCRKLVHTIDSFIVFMSPLKYMYLKVQVPYNSIGTADLLSATMRPQQFLVRVTLR